MSEPKSLRPGDTPEKRRLESSSTATSAPTAGDSGWPTDNADWLHVWAKFPETVTQANVTPWYYSAIAEDWYAGDPMVFTPSSKFSLIEHRGSGQALRLQITSITGSGTVELWAGKSFDGPN